MARRARRCRRWENQSHVPQQASSQRLSGSGTRRSQGRALLWVWVPKGIEPAELATSSVKRGDKLELVGLGGGTKLADCVRCFRAEASPPSTIEKIFADVPLLPGDSGGPVFNSQHQVVGIISGGWFWWDSGLKTESGAYIRTTWPARASNVGPLQSMLTKLDSNSTMASMNSQNDELIQR